MTDVNVNEGELVASQIEILVNNNMCISQAMGKQGNHDVYIVTEGNSPLCDVYVLPIQDLNKLGFQYNKQASNSEQVKQAFVAAGYLLSERAEPGKRLSRVELIARFNRDHWTWGLYVRHTYEPQ
jgi:hypothetical protein